MDQPDSGPESPDDTYGDDPVVLPPQSDTAHHPEQSIQPIKNQEEGKRYGWYVPKRRRRRFKTYLREFRRAGADRHIELVIAAAVLVFVVLQYCTLRSNNKSTSDQIDKIIKAANGISMSAGSFSTSADKINIGVGNAVGKLNSQAQSTSDVARAAAEEARTSGTIAGAAQQSAITARNALYWEQRPWVGVQIIPTGGSGHARIANNTPTQMATSLGVVLSNTGRTPALHLRQTCQVVETGEAHVMSLPPCEELRVEQENARIQSTLNTIMAESPNQDRGALQKAMEESSKLYIESEDSGIYRGDGRTIVPGGTAPLAFGIVTPRADIVYLVGTFTYFDAIDPTRKHPTHYCLVRSKEVDWQLCDFGQEMK